MSTPYTRRHAGGGTPVAPWLISGVIGAVFAALGAAWIAAHLAAGEGFPVPPYDQVATTLKKQGIPGLIGPAGSRTLFLVVLGGQVALVLGAAVTVTLLVTRNRGPRDGRRAMTAPRAFRDLQLRPMAKRAIGLRPSLKGRKPKTLVPHEVGVSLGDVSGTTLYKSFEDVELVICGPRSNKTSAKVVPDIVSAPGPVVATSNKPDVWLLTSAVRARKGPVYLFDPQQITYQQQRFWINLLALVTSVESASRMASYFMREVGGGGGGADRADPFFTPASQKTLRQMLLAAACSGHTLREVLLWVATRSEEPAYFLERAGYPDQAASLRSTLELAPETKGGIYEGVATALSSLESEALARWVTPPSTWRDPPRDPRSIPELHLWSLITRGGGPHPTLYLLSREGEGSGRPVVAAIVGELIEICFRAATANGGRLDPTICMSLDEAANIVRLPELPNWYSYFGSMGLMVTVILQSREQGRSVWGKEGFDALWSAATIKTVGAGIQDADFAEYLSQLVGDHKVEEISTSYSSGGGSTSRSLRTERIMPASEIAALPKTHALMFSAGRRTALLTLHPWYAERDRLTEQINANSREATTQVQQAAIDYLGPDNPVAAALTAERARVGTGGGR